MATGAGKTFTAANVCYRLVRHADAARVLFLVDRAQPGPPGAAGFQGFAAPDGPPQVQRALQRPPPHRLPGDMAAETSPTPARSSDSRSFAPPPLRCPRRAVHALGPMRSNSASAHV